MVNIVDIRVHHIYDFTRALISKKFRENVYLALEDQGGYCSTQGEAQKVRELLQSISDDTLVRIVLGPDDLCACCEREKDAIWEEACSWNDSVWDCKEMLGKVEPDEIVSVSYLKNQYHLYQRCKDKSNWKKIIAESRRQA
jgi:hypothetical protein